MKIPCFISTVQVATLDREEVEWQRRTRRQKPSDLSTGLTISKRLPAYRDGRLGSLVFQTNEAVVGKSFEAVIKPRHSAAAAAAAVPPRHRSS